jgi:4-carboxymuconolactone decarboxylase
MATVGKPRLRAIWKSTRRIGDRMTEPFARLMQQMMEQSQEMLRAFNPALEKVPAGQLDKMFPTLPANLMEMWFGKTFNRDGLDAKTRMLVTLAALTVLGAQAEPQLRLTVRHAREAGATEREIAEVIWQMSMFAGLPAMQKALEIAQEVFAQEKEKGA